MFFLSFLDMVLSGYISEWKVYNCKLTRSKLNCIILSNIIQTKVALSITQGNYVKGKYIPVRLPQAKLHQFGVIYATMGNIWFKIKFV